MKISKLIEILQLAQQNYGDVDVMIDDQEGQRVLAKYVFKQHPYDGTGLMMRDESVNAIAITDFGWNEDLIGILAEVPAGCVCDPRDWGDQNNLPPVCRSFKPSLEDKKICDNCEHLVGCHAS